jgi:hypothetical protein
VVLLEVVLGGAVRTSGASTCVPVVGAWGLGPVSVALVAVESGSNLPLFDKIVLVQNNPKLGHYYSNLRQNNPKNTIGNRSTHLSDSAFLGVVYVRERVPPLHAVRRSCFACTARCGSPRFTPPVLNAFLPFWRSPRPRATVDPFSWSAVSLASALFNVFFL